MKTLLLIDANSLIHRFFHAMPPFTDLEGNPSGALYGLSGVILKILREQRPDYIAAAYDTPEKTFREEEFKEYKIHRPPTANELVHQLINSRRVFEAFKINVFPVPGFEADDILGTLAEKFKNELDTKIVILSGDNDMLQLVEDEKILVQIIKTGITETVMYDESAVNTKYGLKPDKLTDYKGLVGDQSDNIPGIKGVGPKTASLLIKEFGNIENIFDNLGVIPDKIRKKIEGGKEVAMLSKRLATIRRDVPIKIGGLNELKTAELDKNVVQSYFEKMGFGSLILRLNK
ncbi:MAG: 5'-3' exonuclease H3TH domain-containing protein [Patescibacteria group bacterium]